MVVLGRIVAPFGVRGWLKVFPLGDDPDAWRDMDTWWLAADPEGGTWQAHELADLKLHGRFVLAGLADVADRGAAEGLQGVYVGAPREALPEARRDEFYWADLIGLQVVNEQGEALGRVESLIESGAHDVLVVREGERERLLPFVAQVVKKVDVPGGVMSVAWGRDW